MKKFTSLNRKLLWAVLISSSIITTFITIVSLYTEYKTEVRQQNRDIDYLEKSFIPSMELSMWTFDQPQTLSQIKGVLSSHNVFRVLIRDKNRVLFDEGKKGETYRTQFEKKYRLTHESSGQRVELGDLTLFVTKDPIYDRLMSSVLRTFFAQAAKTFMIIFVLLAIFQHLITRHLKRISEYVQSIEISEGGSPGLLTLQGPRQKGSDEMDLLVDALNFHIQSSKSYQEKIVRLKDEAQQATRTKSLFLGSVSHELRTPLNIILGMGELLQEMETSKECSEYLSAQTRAGNHLRRMIDDLLDLTKIEAGQLGIERKAFDLKKALNEIVTMLRVEAKKRENTIVLELAKDLPDFVKSDMSRLTQILLNLLGNANKFTEKGTIRLSATVIGQFLQFEVIDTGIGIEEKNQEKIFEPFKQVDESYSKKYKGSGIGLSLSRVLARALGGDIRVESRLGQGSRFICMLPLEIAATGTVGGLVSRVEKKQEKRRTLLFVDDDIDNRVLLEHYMKGTNHEFYFAMDGAQAVEETKALRPDLVFMDIQMPTMDGYEAVKRIREWELVNGMVRTPIVALSALTATEDLRRAITVGCDDFISKPVRKEEILRLIDQYAKTRGENAPDFDRPALRFNE